LLSTVVEIALDPASLLIAGLHDARARRSQLSAGRPQFGVQPLVFQCEPRRGADCLHKFALFRKAGVVEDRSDRPAFVLDRRGDLSLRCRIDPRRPTFGVYVSALVW